MAETRRDCVTLAALLAVLQERGRVLIVHRTGPHECEGVAGGTVQELRFTRCVLEASASKVFSLVKWAEAICSALGNSASNA